jgi:Glycosyl hydrolases family 18
MSACADGSCRAPGACTGAGIAPSGSEWIRRGKGAKSAGADGSVASEVPRLEAGFLPSPRRRETGLAAVPAAASAAQAPGRAMENIAEHAAGTLIGSVQFRARTAAAAAAANLKISCTEPSMSTETFINYWIGQAPTPPCPTFDAMPAYVDVAPLAFVTINDSWELDFGFLCTNSTPAQIQGWIKTVRQNGTKVLFSINDQKIGQVPDVNAFVANVVQNAVEWGVDGVDIDFEPPSENETVIQIAAALRPALENALGTEPLITAPIYSPWLNHPPFLHRFAEELDFVTTMDYTPYISFDETISLFNQYAAAIGSPGKVAIGVSCMGPSTSSNFTPLDDVKQLCAWEPDGGTKKGIMLYTYSYDVETRPDSGTGYPDGTFTETIHQYLP